MIRIIRYCIVKAKKKKINNKRHNDDEALDSFNKNEGG